MSINSPSSHTNPSQPSSSSNWSEPPWSGWIESTGDALLILEAARRGLIPRVTRRLVDSERKMITSGSVFVFDEDESGIKRWTDGFFWSPSRILGNFLLYRETDKRGSGSRGARSDPPVTTEQPNPLLVNEHTQYNADGVKVEGQALSRPKGDVSGTGLDRHRERSLVGSLTNSYKFKSDGMMKKTFSLTIGGVSQHLISYYKIEDVEQGRLRTPSSLPEIASLDISPEYLDKTHFRNPPKVEIGIDGIPRYRGEADESDQSPRTTTAPLSTGPPMLVNPHASADGTTSDSGATTPTTGKRAKRFDPYGGPSAANTKRSRKTKAAVHPITADTQAPGHQSQSPSIATSPQTPFATPDQNIPPPQHQHFPTYSIPPPNYFHQVPPPGYPMHAPPPHMYVSPQSGPATEGSTPPPNTSSPVPSGQPAYPAYQPSGDAGANQHYAFFAPPPGHYTPYNGMPWGAPYSYPPMQGLPQVPAVGQNMDTKGAGDEGAEIATGGEEA